MQLPTTLNAFQYSETLLYQTLDSTSMVPSQLNGSSKNGSRLPAHFAAGNNAAGARSVTLLGSGEVIMTSSAANPTCRVCSMSDRNFRTVPVLPRTCLPVG